MGAVKRGAGAQDAASQAAARSKAERPQSEAGQPTPQACRANAAQTRRRRRLRRAGLAGAVSVTAAMMAAPAIAADPAAAGVEIAQLSERFTFNIAAQPLASALTQFGQQSGLQVTVDGAIVRDQRVPSVAGTMTAEQALRQLLTGSGLTYRLSGNTTVAIQKAAADDGAVMLDPIVVETQVESAYGPVDGYRATRSATGTKMNTAIMDTPASVQVVPRQVLEDQKAIRLADALRNVSSVHSSGTTGNRSENFIVRGLPSSRIATDGFLSAATFGDVGFLNTGNIERVEVLKGPASVLYGAADPGGLINIVTKKPEEDAFYTFSGTYGSYDLYRGDIDFNVPLTEDGTVLSRLNASYQNADSFRNYFTRAERFSIAPSLTWMPNDRTTVEFKAEYFEQEHQYDRGLVVVDGDPLALPIDRYLGEPGDRAKADELRVQAGIEHALSDDWTVRLRARTTDSNSNPQDTYPLGLQVDGRTLDRQFYVFDQHFQTYAAEAGLEGKLTTADVEHHLLFGLDTQLTRFHSQNFTATATSIDIFDPVYGGDIGPLTSLGQQQRNIDLYGGYLQDIVSIGEQWKVLVGGRFDIAKTQYQRGETWVTDKVDTQFSPRIGVVYQPIETVSLYASYSESFIPLLSGQSVGDEPLEPETGTQVEIGIKHTAFDERLSTTFALFQLTRENVSTSDLANPGFSIQIGEQRSRGAELEVAGEVLPGWQVIGSLSYLDSEVTKDNTFSEGNRLPNVPEWSGSIWSTYALQDPTFEGLELGAGVFVVGKREGDLNNSFTVPGYARVDLMARYELVEDVDLSVNIYNLFDTEYVEASASAREIYTGAPLTALATLSVRF
ncbi:TonB-dependent receptor [Pelagibius sp. 7325]|uniref:TonB-dependent siderophore receptor n=1 Tax=Pelagibius sp. 7325 TaxID=3131994 RepID=UPI0030EDA83F